MQKQEKLREQEYSYKDYLTWPDGEHWEIIEGKAYPTYGATALAAPTEAHQGLVVELVRLLGNYLRGKSCKVYVAPFDVVFEQSNDTKTVVQPDVLVVCDPEKTKNGKKVIGAPDIVAEVLSPSTISKDWMKKSRLYESQGVKEYWIISPEAKTLYKNTLEDGHYQTAALEEGTLTSGVLEGFSLDIGEFFSILNENQPPADEQVLSGDSAAIASAEQKGRQEERLEIAKKALQEGASAELVQKISGLDAATMEGLATE